MDTSFKSYIFPSTLCQVKLCNINWDGGNIYFIKIRIQVIYSFYYFFRLLDREQVRDEDAAANDEEENSFLKAFKVIF